MRCINCSKSSRLRKSELPTYRQCHCHSTHCQQIAVMQFHEFSFSDMDETGEQDGDQNGSSSVKKTKSRSQPKAEQGSAKKADGEAAEHLRKAHLESKVRERVASETKAFDVVNRLIEPNISTEYFLEAVCIKTSTI